MRLLAMLWLAAAAGAAQRPPEFKDYPVTEVYRGPVARPVLTKPQERMYRTVIRQGVRSGPSFAGRYVIVEWGCGSDCSQYAIVDARNGKVFQPPVLGSHIAYFDSGELEYELGSRLMISNTNCAAGEPERCDKEFYLWQNERWIYLQRLPRDAQRSK